MPPKPHILITAGPTREKIDDVRDWGNIFTGKTGLDLALAFTDLGNVTLLTSNLDHASEYDGYYGKLGMLGVETFHTHNDLRNLLHERMTAPEPINIVAMTAAVSDYTPAGVFQIANKITNTDGTESWTVQNISAPKVKSTHGEIAVRGTRTEKLIDLFRTTTVGGWNYKNLLIKFKLEVAITEEQLIQVASASRTASNADLIVANTLAMARPQDGTEASAYLIDNAGPTRVPRNQLAHKIVAWSRARLT